MFYIEQLVRHAQPQLKEKHPRKKLLQNLQPLAKILKDLEVDLRTNPNDSWVQEFVSTPNHGHVALIDLIKDLADNPYSVPRKNPKKYAVLEREPVSECPLYHCGNSVFVLIGLLADTVCILRAQPHCYHCIIVCCLCCCFCLFFCRHTCTQLCSV